MMTTVSCLVGGGRNSAPIEPNQFGIETREYIVPKSINQFKGNELEFQFDDSINEMSHSVKKMIDCTIKNRDLYRTSEFGYSTRNSVCEKVPFWEMEILSDYKAKIYYNMVMPQCINEKDITNIKCNLLNIPYKSCQLLILNQLNFYQNENIQIDKLKVPHFITKHFNPENFKKTYLIRNGNTKLPNYCDYKHQYLADCGKILYDSNVNDTIADKKNEESKFRVLHGIDGNFSFSHQTWTFVFEFDFHDSGGVYHTLFHSNNSQFNYDINEMKSGKEYLQSFRKNKNVKNCQSIEASIAASASINEFSFELYFKEWSVISDKIPRRVYDDDTHDAEMHDKIEEFCCRWLSWYFPSMYQNNWRNMIHILKNENENENWMIEYKRNNIMIGFNYLMTWYEQIHIIITNYIESSFNIDCNWINILFEYISFDQIKIENLSKIDNNKKRMSLKQYINNGQSKGDNNIDMSKERQKLENVSIRTNTEYGFDEWYPVTDHQCFMDSCIINKNHLNQIKNGWVSVSTKYTNHKIIYKDWYGKYHCDNCNGHKQAAILYQEYLSCDNDSSYFGSNKTFLCSRFGKNMFNNMSHYHCIECNNETKDDSTDNHKNNVIIWNMDRFEMSKITLQEQKPYNVINCIENVKLKNYRKMKKDEIESRKEEKMKNGKNFELYKFENMIYDDEYRCQYYNYDYYGGYQYSDDSPECNCADLIQNKHSNNIIHYCNHFDHFMVTDSINRQEMKQNLYFVHKKKKSNGHKPKSSKNIQSQYQKCSKQKKKDKYPNNHCNALRHVYDCIYF